MVRHSSRERSTTARMSFTELDLAFEEPSDDTLSELFWLNVQGNGAILSRSSFGMGWSTASFQGYGRQREVVKNLSSG